MSNTMDKISKMDKDEMLAEFKKADQDGNGKLSAKEIKTMLMAEGDKETEKDVDMMVQVVMQMADEDGDKMLNYEEMVKCMGSEPDQADMAKAMFKMCDTDGDGGLSKKELIKMMKMMADDQEEVEEASMMVKMMMMMGDEDGDGKISYEEYTKMMSE